MVSSKKKVLEHSSVFKGVISPEWFSIVLLHSKDKNKICYANLLIYSYY